MMTPRPVEELREELSRFKAGWALFLALGILQVVVGTILIAAPQIGTFFAVWMLSALMMVVGITQFVGAFYAKGWGGFFLSLLIGVLYFVAGLVIVERTPEAAGLLTAVIAVFLIVGGAFRILVATMERFAGWGWVLASGILSVILGVLIWRQLPGSALWVIGLFVGIEMVFNGFTWIGLALAVRKAFTRIREAVKP